MQEPLDAVNMLQDVFDRRFVETGVVLYLISDILNKFNSTDMEDQKQLLMVVLIILYSSAALFYVLTCR